jgi:hypothetical protein
MVCEVPLCARDDTFDEHLCDGFYIEGFTELFPFLAQKHYTIDRLW